MSHLRKLWATGWCRRAHERARIVALVVVAALADPLGAVPPPAPEQGSIEPIGKFVPRPAEGRSEDGAPVMDREAAEGQLAKELKLVRVDATRMRIGNVTLDREKRSVRFPATVNMTEGAVEYAVVTAEGKKHESVFVTTAAPGDIHAALLLLGIKPGPWKGGDRGKLAIPEGASVTVAVEWETNGPPVRHPLAAMVAMAEGAPDQVAGKTMADGPWLYNGSVFDSAGFRAAREGSVIALIADAAALLNNPGEDRGNDELHVPNKKLLPRPGMPVTVEIAAGKP